jgi:hypothetical protein
MRHLFLPLVLTLALACSGDDDDGGATPDAALGAPDAPGAPDADTRTQHTFVVSALDLPTNASEATMLGLDIDEKPGDGVDNQLGMFFGSLAALAPNLDLQANLDASLARGELIVLLALHATGLFDAAPVDAWLGRAQTDPPPTPAPCADANDTVCRHHLDGSGMFVVAQSDGIVTGTIAGGDFDGGPSTLTLWLPLFSPTVPVELPLQKARVHLENVTAFGLGSGCKLGGAVTMSDFSTRVVPSMATGMRQTFAADCTIGGTPPSCDCAPGSTGETLRSLFDKTPNDCQISDTEVEAVMGSILTPDIDLDGDGTNDAISIGVGINAVTGGYTVP